MLGFNLAADAYSATFEILNSIKENQTWHEAVKGQGGGTLARIGR
jgi:hypothetical protein